MKWWLLFCAVSAEIATAFKKCFFSFHKMLFSKQFFTKCKYLICSFSIISAPVYFVGSPHSPSPPPNTHTPQNLMMHLYTEQKCFFFSIWTTHHLLSPLTMSKLNQEWPLSPFTFIYYYASIADLILQHQMFSVPDAGNKEQSRAFAFISPA